MSNSPFGRPVGRIAVSDSGPQAHLARASAFSWAPPFFISWSSLCGCLSAHMANMWKCIWPRDLANSNRYQ